MSLNWPFLLSVLMASGNCFSQNTATTALLGVAGNGPSDSPIEEPRNLVEIRASTESSKATLRGTKTISHASAQSTPGQPRPSEFSAWSLTIEAPLSKSTNTTDLATLDGLGNSTTVSLKLNRLKATRRIPDDAKLDAICEQLEKRSAGATCDADNIQKHLPATVQREFQSLFWDDSTPRLIYGFQATAGHETFESFSDATSTTKTKKTESPWSVGAHLGLLFRTYGLVTLGYRRENAYEAQPNTSRCTPIIGSSALTCVSSANGTPKQKDGSVATLEWRRQIANFAASIRVSRDFEKDVTGVDVPIYVWSGNDGKLSGGVRAGWRDDSDDVVIGLFVGTTFKMFE